jgi:glutathione S-transferase
MEQRHITGQAPIIEDGPVLFAESSAIAEYILGKYGNGKLVISPDKPNFPDYLYWFHAANGNIQPSLSRCMIIQRGGIDASNPMAQFVSRMRDTSLKMLNDRLSANKWLAGEDFTAADIMTVFSLSTMRLFAPFSLKGQDNILAYLERVSERDGFKRAMEKGDPGFEPIFGADAPEPLQARPE